MGRSAAAALLFLAMFAFAVHADGGHLVDKRGTPVRAVKRVTLEAGAKARTFAAKPAGPPSLFRDGPAVGVDASQPAVTLEAGHKVLEVPEPIAPVVPVVPITKPALFASEPAEPVNVNDAVADAAAATTNTAKTNGLLGYATLTGFQAALRARIADAVKMEAGHKAAEKPSEKASDEASAAKAEPLFKTNLFKSQPAAPLNITKAVSDAVTGATASVKSTGLMASTTLSGLTASLRKRVNATVKLESGLAASLRARVAPPAKKAAGVKAASADAHPVAGLAAKNGTASLSDIVSKINSTLLNSTYIRNKANTTYYKVKKALKPRPLVPLSEEDMDYTVLAPEPGLNGSYVSNVAGAVGEIVSNGAYDAALTTYNTGLATATIIKSVATGMTAFQLARASDNLGKGMRMFGGAGNKTGAVMESGPAHGEKKAERPAMSFKWPTFGGSKVTATPRVTCPDEYKMDSGLGKCTKVAQHNVTECYVGASITCSAGYAASEGVAMAAPVQQLVAGAMALKKAGLSLPKPLQEVMAGAASHTSGADQAATRASLNKHVGAAAAAKGTSASFIGFEARDMVDAGAQLLTVPWATVPDVAQLSAAVTKATKAVPPHMLGDVKAVAPKALVKCCKTTTEPQTIYAAPTIVCDQGKFNMLAYKCE